MGFLVLFSEAGHLSLNLKKEVHRQLARLGASTETQGRKKCVGVTEGQMQDGATGGTGSKGAGR